MDHPVLDRRDAQRAHPPVWFRNLHPAHGRRVVVACPEVTGQLAEHAPDPVVLHRRQGDAIH
ncbi:MAG: hypothetical protein ACREA0_22745, partial [bacterium]